jgi:hypothetical protein
MFVDCRAKIPDSSMPDKPSKFFVWLQGKKVPVLRPEDIIPCLAGKDYHWAAGYSAHELSYRWTEAESVPVPVDRVLSQSPLLQDLELIEGYFEYQVSLNTHGHASQTDLMVLLETRDRNALLAVEGKVREGFGLSVKTWNKTPGRDDRIRYLCDLLGLFYDDLASLGLKYQLVHRTASAVLEAQLRGICRATMLVHTFDPLSSHFRDFQCFCDLLSLPVTGPNQISAFRTVGGVELSLAWVSDSPRSTRALGGD